MKIDDKNEVNVTFKLYPTRYKNNKGFYLGKYSIALESENSPTGLLAEVDYYLNSVFKNMINDMKSKSDKTKEEPNNIIPVIVEKIKLNPGKYKQTENHKALIGGIKTRGKNSKRKRNKTQRKGNKI